MGAEQVGIKFVQQYFETLSARPEQLHTFYAQDSTYSCGHCARDQKRDQAVQGLENIRAKILAQRFEDCIVNVFTIDVHAVKDNGVLVMVFGALMRDEATSKFVHTFFLAAETVNERYFISNAMFRALDESFPLVAPATEVLVEESPREASSSTAEVEPEGVATEEADLASNAAPEEATEAGTPVAAAATEDAPAAAPAAAPATPTAQSYAAMAAARATQPQQQPQQHTRTPKAKTDGRKKQEHPADKAPPQTTGADARTLFVKASKESPLVDESVMEQLRPLGAVEYTQVKTHAYVVFSSAAAAQKLLKAQALLFNGFPLIVEQKRAGKPARRPAASNRGARTNSRRGGRGRDRGGQ